MQLRFGALRLGTVLSFRKPWFEVVFDDGATQHMRGRELSRSLIFAPPDYHDPRLRNINWILTYMRASTEDKMRASWALGL